MKKFFYEAHWLVVPVGLVVVFFATIIIMLLSMALATKSLEVQEPEPPKYAFSEEEKELMAQVLWVEAGAHSTALQEACASVMVNQLDSGWYGATITEVLTRSGAYDGYRLIERADGQNIDDCRRVVEEICQNGSKLPEYIWFFRADHGFSWKGVETYIIIDNVWFQFFPENLRAQGWH